MMKAIWSWIKVNILGIKPIPNEIYETTTAVETPEDYSPEEVVTIVNEPKLDGDAEVEWEPEDEKMNVVFEDAPEENYGDKYAVLIGINIYDPDLDADLNGCVNDVEAMHNILVNTYGFPADNIRMLTDQRATRQAIYDRIKWLITEHTTPGDELVLHYSGHGSQVRDRNGDELSDTLDEILCPTNLDWDNPFTDDQLCYLFKQKAEGVNLTFICDSCHSGTMTRELHMPTTTEAVPVELIGKSRFVKPPSDIFHRSVDRDLTVNVFGSVDRAPKVISQNHVLLSGCRDDQTSADAHIDGKWQGALTSSLIKAIKKNPHRNWTEIHAEVISILNVAGYSQRPQLSGNTELVKGRSIFGA